MSSSDSTDITDDAAARQDDAAARQAAEVAVELSESGGPPDTRRLARGLRAVADRASTAVTAATATARRGTATRRAGARGRAQGGGRSRPWRPQGRRLGRPRPVGRHELADRAGGGDGAAAAHPRPGHAARAVPRPTDDEIAQLLIERAARAAAAVGGTTGAWAALPVLPAFPAEVAAETLAVVGIEVKLVAELHEIYGMAAAGQRARERARAYLGSWATRRGVYQVDGGLLLIAGSPLARQLTRRLAARVRRSAFSLGPLFTGAVAGALINRRETRRLGRQIRDELRGSIAGRSPPP